MVCAEGSANEIIHTLLSVHDQENVKTAKVTFQAKSRSLSALSSSSSVIACAECSEIPNSKWGFIGKEKTGLNNNTVALFPNSRHWRFPR